MDKKQGKLIVMDGIDGSGKTTQIELLAQSLKEQNIPHEVISFPRYEDNIYGKLIKRYLTGEFGSINEVNPYLMALAYAGDRALAKAQIEKWLSDGKVVLANRYISASKAHMGANLPENKRVEFMDWLDELEYQTNGMPKEDLTILLTVDPKKGQLNVSGKGTADLHEQNLKHLQEAHQIYLSLAKSETNWYLVDCMSGESMKVKEDIHREIMQIVKDKL